MIRLPLRSTLFSYTTLFRSSFKYKGMVFHNVKDNLFQTDKFGDKLIYRFEDGKYHLVRDERLSNVIGIDEVSRNPRSEEHTSELQSRPHLVCRLLLEKKKNI